MDIKKLKAELKKKTDAEPDKFYATEVLKAEGFERKKCAKCGKMFWTTSGDDFCGEPECQGGYTFIGNSPSNKQMDFIGVWKKFSNMFKKFGYTPIERYPVVARWRDDSYWTNASIYDFQPHVVSGAVEPPANPLVVPQMCMRFNDIDNVGITGRHYTCFVMIGQHAFEPPEKYDVNSYFTHIHKWLTDGMGVPKDELKYHEDQWGGGGNLGPCMEYFSHGLEIGNQVYMTYQIIPGGYRELNLKVLDMGMGQERPAWFTHGTDTSYEVNFPTVVKQLYDLTGVKPKENIMRKFLPYSGLLNMEETDDIEKVWKGISDNTGIDLKELKETVKSLSAIYSIGDHTRALLFAINDGAIPSNVGGCYNLRVLLRRALGFIDTYGWGFELADICETHAKYLKPQFPEVLENLDEVAEILDVEKQRYYKTLEKSKGFVRQVIRDGVTDDMLVELYDSKGISPEFLKEEAEKLGHDIEIPKDFYAKLAARHEDNGAIEKKGAGELDSKDYEDLPDTIKLYYKDTHLFEFQGKVLRIIGNTVVLDQTAFYPTSGGQQRDQGIINGIRVSDVQKIGNIVVHTLASTDGVKEGGTVEGKIEEKVRMALTKNHTAAHVIGGAARRVLGKHIWQAGSQIDLEKGRLDVTHYANITPEQRAEIEKLANQAIKENHEIIKGPVSRNDAEKKHGFTLYQGGAIPGKEIRVMNIKEWDVQACGGTHVDDTAELEKVRIVKTEKISDGVVRIIFKAGKELVEEEEKEYEKEGKDILDKLNGIQIRKEVGISDIEAAARFFKVAAEQLPKTIERFVGEINAANKKLGKDAVPLEGKAETLEDAGKLLFEHWKNVKKKAEYLDENEADKLLLKATADNYITKQFDDFSAAMKMTSIVCNKNKEIVAIFYSKGRTVCAVGQERKVDAVKTLEKAIPSASVNGNSKRAIADKPLDIKAEITLVS